MLAPWIEYVCLYSGCISLLYNTMAKSNCSSASGYLLESNTENIRMSAVTVWFEPVMVWTFIFLCAMYIVSWITAFDYYQFYNFDVSIIIALQRLARNNAVCAWYIVAKTKHWTHHGEHAHTSFSDSGRQLRLMRPDSWVSCMIASVNIGSCSIKSEINPVFTDWAYIYISEQ